MVVLAVNSGSSSLKFKVVEVNGEGKGAARDRARIHYDGAIERLGEAATATLRRDGVTLASATQNIPTHTEAVRWMLDALKQSGGAKESSSKIEAIGHRVVHGGERFQRPVRIDDSVAMEIDRLAELAPLHNPGCLAGIRGARSVVGRDVPMVAVFDTAFHRHLPATASTYAIDLDVAKKHGIRRYGFHGIAHASMAGAYAAAVNRPRDQVRIVTLQLGNGCSAAAIDRGRSVDTSMGFTPLEGLVMGTRSGDLDPALVGYLARAEGLSFDEVERLLNARSGLLGLSGLSHDMRTVLAAAERNPESRAALAVEVFCYRAKKYLGAYLAALGGAEAVVFGGGIGERAPAIRARVCAGMDWCGLRLDPVRNDAITGLIPGEAVRISVEGGSLAAYVSGVDEEVEIARETVTCLQTMSESKRGTI